MLLTRLLNFLINRVFLISAGFFLIRYKSKLYGHEKKYTAKNGYESQDKIYGLNKVGAFMDGH